MQDQHAWSRPVLADLGGHTLNCALRGPLSRMLLLVPRGLMRKDEVRQEHHEHTGDFYRMGMCSKPRILNQTLEAGRIFQMQSHALCLRAEKGGGRGAEDLALPSQRVSTGVSDPVCFVHPPSPKAMPGRQEKVGNKAYPGRKLK